MSLQMFVYFLVHFIATYTNRDFYRNYNCKPDLNLILDTPQLSVDLNLYGSFKQPCTPWESILNVSAKLYHCQLLLTDVSIHLSSVL